MKYVFLIFIITQLSFAEIIGGKTVTAKDYPWYVSVYDKEIKSHCGGSIVHPKFIITAAHCVFSSAIKNLIIIPESARLVNGSYYLENTLTVKKIFVHDDYSKVLKKPSEYSLEDLHLILTKNTIEDKAYFESQNDIAIIELNEELTLTKENIDKIALYPSGDYYVPEKNVVLIGRGFENRLTMESAKSLKEAVVPLLPPYKNSFWNYQNQKKYFQELIKDYVSSYSSIRNMIATDETQDIASCFGDSGSPVMIKEKDQLYLLGVNADIVGDKSSLCVGVGRSTSINYHLDWIKNIIPDL